LVKVFAIRVGKNRILQWGIIKARKGEGFYRARGGDLVLKGLKR